MTGMSTVLPALYSPHEVSNCVEDVDFKVLMLEPIGSKANYTPGSPADWVEVLIKGSTAHGSNVASADLIHILSSAAKMIARSVRAAIRKGTWTPSLASSLCRTILIDVLRLRMPWNPELAALPSSFPPRSRRGGRRGKIYRGRLDIGGPLYIATYRDGTPQVGNPKAKSTRDGRFAIGGLCGLPRNARSCSPSWGLALSFWCATGLSTQTM